MRRVRNALVVLTLTLGSLTACFHDGEHCVNSIVVVHPGYESPGYWSGKSYHPGYYHPSYTSVVCTQWVKDSPAPSGSH